MMNKNYLKFQVIDTGMGISQANMSKLFKLFGKLKESQGVNQQGVGLGLTICKKITESMGGMIEVESEVGVGSTFSFYTEFNNVGPALIPDSSCFDDVNDIFESTLSDTLKDY